MVSGYCEWLPTPTGKHLTITRHAMSHRRRLLGYGMNGKILGRVNHTRVRATHYAFRVKGKCYGALHATITSGGVRFATVGGAKIAR
jgi:hypothetical protein